MQMPVLGGGLDFKDWFKGLVAAFVSGGASAVTSGFTVSALDPKGYNFQSSKIYTLMLAMFLVNGIMGAMMFLRQKPVPDITPSGSFPVSSIPVPSAASEGTPPKA